MKKFGLIPIRIRLLKTRVAQNVAQLHRAVNPRAGLMATITDSRARDVAEVSNRIYVFARVCTPNGGTLELIPVIISLATGICW